ncbi:MAG TPA: trypsin-like serine protease, partial [Porticoccaceae bacterium]|nr:trypsin-like serine protease [Porticoccaceae bacterium]
TTPPTGDEGDEDTTPPTGDEGDTTPPTGDGGDTTPLTGDGGDTTPLTGDGGDRRALERQLISSRAGSGFFVSKLGHVVTSAQVVQDCNRITVGDNAIEQVRVEIINVDKSNDLALLKLSPLEMSSAKTKSLIQKLINVIAPLASNGLLRSSDVRLGEKVLVAGYPSGDFFSNRRKVASDVASSTHEADDDSGKFQLDAVLQRDNSGGPIYDRSGNIVGVVTSQLYKLKTAGAISSMPESVNLGTKASSVRQFLMSSGLPSKKAEQTEQKSTEKLTEIAQSQALMVMCLRKNQPKSLQRLPRVRR